MPILLAGVLFYLLNPVVKLIQKIKIGKYHISRTWAVALIFLIFFAVLAGGIVWLIPRLIQQVSTLVNNVPNIIKIIQNGLTDINDKLSSYKWLQNVDFSKYGAQIEKNLASYAQKFMNGLTSSVGTVVGMITSVTVVAVTVPVMLFYMLKDGHKLIPRIKKNAAVKTR